LHLACTYGSLLNNSLPRFRGVNAIRIKYRIMISVPNWQHHSKKAQKIRLKPQAVRARKEALRALKRKLEQH
jgi:hypothetical protein